MHAGCSQTLSKPATVLFVQTLQTTLRQQPDLLEQYLREHCLSNMRFYVDYMQSNYSAALEWQWSYILLHTLQQGCPNSVLEERCPAEFSSNSN